VARKKSVFVVLRLNWRPTGGGAWWLAPGTARLASFPTRDEAEVERARREANARKRVNPFRCDKPLAELTTMPGPIFRDWVRDTGLTPPDTADDAPDAWAAWWAAERFGMSAEQLVKLWEGLNRVHFFRVDERADGPVAFAVMRTITRDNGDGPFFSGEGGQVSAVYRTREQADGACLYAGAEGENYHWHPTGADLFDPETYWRMAVAGGPFDIIEIELDENAAKPGKKFHLVVRRTWTSSAFELNLNQEERIPVRGFSTKKDAETCRRELDAEFRREWDAWPWFVVWWAWQGLEEEFDKLKRAAVRLKMIAPDAEPMNWWHALTVPPTADQRAALWAAVSNNNRAYEVIQTQLVD
jgi:hypothetical protein